VLGFADREPRPLANAVLDALVRREGEAAVFTRSFIASGGRSARAAWSSRVAPSVLATLRAAAIVGPTFEVELVAELLRKSPLEVLLDLQSAVDAGAPIVDRGDGVLTIDARAAEQLRDGLLPSLRSAWHAQVARCSRARPRTKRDRRGVEPREASVASPGPSSTRHYAEPSEPANTRSWSDDAPSFDEHAPPCRSRRPTRSNSRSTRRTRTAQRRTPVTTPSDRARAEPRPPPASRHGEPRTTERRAAPQCDPGT
jgi:hypothetical protein